MKNRYIHRSKITEKKFKQILQLFCLDLNASQIADIAGINRNTVNRYLTGVRGRISRHCMYQADIYFSCPVVEEEQMCFENGEEISFLGIAKDNGNIRSRVIPKDMGRRYCHTKNRKNGDGQSTTAVFTDISGLIDLKRMRYIKIVSETDCGNGRPQGIDICDGFWGVVRGRLHHFRGLKKSTLLLHIRECEFRYNYRRETLFDFLIELFRKVPLFSKASDTSCLFRMDSSSKSKETMEVSFKKNQAL